MIESNKTINGTLYPDFKVYLKRIGGKLMLIGDYGDNEERQIFYPADVKEAFHWADRLVAYNGFNNLTCFN